MIMVHKATQLPTPPASQHRRAPSAPTLSVQPTKTPGLLSLSKPPAPAKTQRQQRSPKLKAAQAATVPQQQRSPKQAPAQAHPVPSTASTTPSAGSPSPEQRPRGRQHHGKDNKGRRNTSNSPAHRNPSSPALAENVPAQTAPRRPATRRPQSFAAPKGSDPFLVPASDLPSAAPAAGKSIRPTPALSAQPSGKLARRRRPGPDSPTPAHAKAVPIPHVTSHPGLPLSRSAPTNVTRPGPRRSTAPEGIAFPVCDDTAEEDDEPAYRRFDDGLRTAPQATFGFPTTPSPRIRSSSGGFMSGSFDEEYLNTPVDDVRSLLFGLSPATAFPQSFVPKDLRFANSQFQNSPDPDDLPSL